MGKALHVCNPTNVASGNEGSVGGGSGNNATEANSQYSIEQAGTWSNLGFNQQGGNGTNTARLRLAGADGTCVVSVAGNGWNADNVNSDANAAATLINYAFTDTGTNPTFNALKILFTSNSDHVTYQLASSVGSVNHDVQSATRYINFGGPLGIDGNATEANARTLCRVAGALKYFQVRVSGNARTNTSTFGVNINGSPGTNTVQFATMVTGLVVDTTHTDNVADGDLYGATITLGTGVEDLNVCLVAISHTNSAGQKNDLILGFGAGQARTASATPHYFALGGTHVLSNTTENQYTLKPGFAGRASKLRVFVSANTYTGSSTLVFRLNAGAGITLTINAGATGWIENTTDTVDFDATDDLCYAISGGTANSITIMTVVITIEDLTPVVSTGLGPLIGGWRNHRAGAGAVLH